MDIVLNDYSLNGQFVSIDDFTLYILKEYLKMFEYFKEKNIHIYKKSDFYSKNITEKITVGELLSRAGDPIITKIKTFIVCSYEEPYWDVNTPKTDLSCKYICQHSDSLPNCFSEAIERDRTIISVKNDEYLCDSFLCYKNEEEIILHNITDYSSFLNWLLNSNIPDVKYVFENYRFQRKICFVTIENKCYAEEAIQNNNLTEHDKRIILLNISELINGLSSGAKNRFWDSLSNGIFEYRNSVSNGREFRLLFAQENAICFLNGFIKKEQRTPNYEIEKAKRIFKDYKQLNIK